jgi:hypothetical protein
MTNHAQRLHNRDGRVRWMHPDCGFWMLKRSIVGRYKYLGR